jgi:hypothetical protein
VKVAAAKAVATSAARILLMGSLFRKMRENEWSRVGRAGFKPDRCINGAARTPLTDCLSGAGTLPRRLAPRK